MIRKVAQICSLLAAALLLAACSILPTARPRTAVQSGATPTPIPTPVVPDKPVYKVQKGEVVRKLQFTGRIAPVKEQELFFRVAGRVKTVPVKAQDTVVAGEVLADLENEDIQRDLTSARLELERAQGRAALAETSQADTVKKAQIDLTIAQQQLAKIQSANPAPRKAAAEVDLERAQIALKKAQEDYNGIAWRNDKGMSQEAANLQEATLNAQAAQAAYDMTLEDINGHSHDVAIAQQQVAAAQLALDAAKRGVDPLVSSDIKAAELNVKKLEASLADTQIVAPFDGLITAVSAYEGRAAEQYKPVITIADPKTLEVRVDTTSTPTNELAVGMPAAITLVGRPGVEIKGKIRQLPYTSTAGQEADEADKSLRISMESGTDAGYEMGDLARVSVVLETKADALWLPVQAIRTFEGRRFVVVQDGGAQRRVDVKVGIEGDDRTEILEGLTEGQTVIGQ